MLWAQFQPPRNDAEFAAMGIGALVAALVCGSIPIGVGMTQKKPVLGIFCGLFTGCVAFLFGCCGGLPTAMLSCGLITIVAQMMPAPSMRAPTPYAVDEDEYDDFARPFQLPGSKHGDTPSGMSDRDRERRHQEKYGFRPRPRRPDPPAESDF